VIRATIRYSLSHAKTKVGDGVASVLWRLFFHTCSGFHEPAHQPVQQREPSAWFDVERRTLARQMELAKKAQARRPS
jgi:hypothetical protein